jgi:hypothetical protein
VNGTQWYYGVATTVEKISTVSEHIAISAVRKVILKNIDSDIEEGMQYGMIGYYVPHSVFPAGYHCDPRQPLPYVNLGSQKNHMAIYMMGLYASSPLRDWFESAWIAAGKKLDIGKSCIRFKKVDDLAMDVLAEALRRVSVKNYIKVYEEALEGSAGRRQSAKSKRPAVKKTASTKVAKKAVKKSKSRRAT